MGIFKATTGLPDLQWPDKQCVPDAAIPEGNYKLFIQFQGEAPIRNAADCDLGPSWGWSTIPRGQAAGTCEIYWANWGYNRIRLESADEKTRKACVGKRGGFYIHDSTKGYSHGCIEVEPVFFRILKQETEKENGEKTFTVNVKYVSGQQTNGGTKQ
ncbi:DUF2778 domain-containing protein [Salmonella enterica]|nr:DUF2778 domain-containing protein [Salmonella enterica subsp. enterica serovar Typhimurium]EEP3423147.1 DUF2778 domain-containing protein [Salmonella enterica]